MFKINENLQIRKFDGDKDSNKMHSHYLDLNLDLDTRTKLIKYTKYKFGQKIYSLYYEDEFVGLLKLGNLEPFYLSIAINKLCYIFNFKYTSFLFFILNKVRVLSYFEISDIFILSKFRGKGFSKHLIEFAAEKAKEYSNDKKLHLLVNKDNKIALSLYEKYSFIKNEPYKYNTNKILMYKKI